MAACSMQSLTGITSGVASNVPNRCIQATHTVGVTVLACRNRNGGGRDGVGLKEHLGRGLRLAVAVPEIQTLQRVPGLKVEAAKRKQTHRSLALSSTLIVEDGKEEAASALCKSICKWGEATIKGKSSGLLVFECNADPFEKNTYHFWERYDSFESMNEIRSSPVHSKFMTDVRPLLVKPIGLAAYEYLNGQIGEMLNPIGPKGEGGLDDATGQAGTKQQSSSIGQGLGNMEEDEGSTAWGLEKLLAKVRGEEKEGGWNLKTLFEKVTK